MIREAGDGLRSISPLTLDDQKALVALSLVPGVGPGRIGLLVQAFGSPTAAMAASSADLAGISGIGARTARRIAAFDQDDVVDRQLEAAERVGAELITQWDERFPYLLRQIYDPPAFLWVRGHLPYAHDRPERCMSIVGTRRPSEYGKRVTRELSYSLAAVGFSIVSGLAYGIDAAAHAAALEAGGRTVAVLGSGVDRIYPGRHARLAAEIMEAGAVISEYPLGAAPDAPNFPRRNRVVSGLGLGTIVVEAYEEGGALITARLALEQNREVFAVPGSIYSASSAGTNRLIQSSSAKLVQQVGDILDELGVAPAATAGSPAAEVDTTGLLPVERAICDVLSDEPIHINRVCSAAGIDPATALVHLLNLEFRGVVRQLAGMQFFLCRRAAT